MAYDKAKEDLHVDLEVLSNIILLLHQHEIFNENKAFQYDLKRLKKIQRHAQED